MTDLEILENYQQPFPVSFRVIGVGTGAADVIEEVKALGYDCVGCMVAQSPDDCIPADEDQMAIIVTRDTEDMANAIARTYHDAGVLTIGLLNNADPACFDSVAIDSDFVDFPEIIKCILHPIVTSGILCFDFNDLRVQLHDSGYFKTLTAEAENVENAVIEIHKSLGDNTIKETEDISVHIFFNREKTELKTADVLHLTNMISRLPESVNARWSVNIDDSMPADKIRLTVILSGRELR